MATFNVVLQNGETEKDADAAKLIVNQENARRAELDPPEDALPMSNTAELKASYEWCLEQTVLKAHESYQKQAAEALSLEADAKQLWEDATNAQRQAAITALGG
jgi:hypothetical protein